MNLFRTHRRPALAASWLGLALAFGLVSSASAQTIDRVFGHGLEDADFPANDDEAARFLTQATFGPDRASIIRVRQLGYRAWIAEQVAQPITLQRPFLEPITDAQGSNTPTTYNQSRRLDHWFHSVTFGPDQLRQRVAWALSQIFVVSDRQDNLNGDPDNLAEYWDILARNSFGSYRTLLQQVSTSPAMGKYLTSMRNRSQYTTGNPPITILPDENYAREVMQLFSIGLVKRNLDFSPQLQAGVPVPTYDQAVITNLARVFTGFNYDRAGNNTFAGTPLPNNPATWMPMRCQETAQFGNQTLQVHDPNPKTIFDGLLINTLPSGEYCDNDLAQALDHLANHANVGPFMARQLIQRLVTSNPSPAYIARVAAVFNNNGSGGRGDLGAVVRSILLDPEARGAATGLSVHGKAREPLLKLVALWRAFSPQAPAPLVEPGTPTGASYIPMGTRNPEGAFQQRPLGAPTVFNFYEPDFQQPGALDAADAYSPEFQILNEVTLVNAANSLRSYAFRYVGAASPQPDWVLLNYADLAALSNTALVDALNTRLLYGRMSLPTRQALLNFLATPAIAGMTALNKVAETVSLIVVGPEFGIQK